MSSAPSSAVSRRGLLAVAGASLVAACGGDDEEARRRRARTAADLEIVRFLLRVERIGTAYWEEVVTRNAVSDVEGASDLAQELATNERTHVEVLERYERRLGGDQAVSAPPSTTFAEIFAAGPKEILRSGGGLANVSAAAYLGQSNRIQDRNILASVLAIHTVEGRQALALNRIAGEDADEFPDGAFAEPLTMAQVRSRLKRYAS